MLPDSSGNSSGQLNRPIPLPDIAGLGLPEYCPLRNEAVTLKNKHKIVSFETVDLDGNPVTSEELFVDHDVTVINIWATWCINCKQEMEELEALNKEWADKGCQIIGICDDSR